MDLHCPAGDGEHAVSLPIGDTNQRLVDAELTAQDPKDDGSTLDGAICAVNAPVSILEPPE